MSNRDTFAQRLAAVVKSTSAIALAEALAAATERSSKTWQNQISTWTRGSRLPSKEQWRRLRSVLPTQDRPELDRLFASALADDTRPSPASLNLWNLGVHASINSGSSGNTVSRYEPAQPTAYISRPHDQRLRDHLELLLQPDARPLMIVMVGESSTGKTRAIFEAVSYTLADWKWSTPTSATQLRDELAVVRSRTVIWLDELQDYLGTADVNAAHALEHALTAHASTPFLVAATIWPDRLASLAGSDDDLSAPGVGRLFEHRATLIQVPPTFTDDEISQALQSSDERVVEAARTGDGKVTQTLAGGTYMVDRYNGFDTALGPAYTPTERAALDAAADLRRAGLWNRLPRWALEDTAVDYLPEDADIDDDWLVRALASCSAKVRGVSALTRRGMPKTGSTYVLHDYLYRHQLIQRQRLPIGPGLWQALIHGAGRLDSDTLRSLADQAHDRGMTSVAARFVTETASRGESDSLAERLYLDLGGVLNGKRPEAAVVGQANHPSPAGRPDRNETDPPSSKSRAATIPRSPTREAAERMYQADDLEGLEELWARPIFRDPYIARRLAGLLRKAGKRDRLTEMARSSAAATKALHEMDIDHYVEVGDVRALKHLIHTGAGRRPIRELITLAHPDAQPGTYELDADADVVPVPADLKQRLHQILEGR